MDFRIRIYAHEKYKIRISKSREWNFNLTQYPFNQVAQKLWHLITNPWICLSVVPIFLSNYMYIRTLDLFLKIEKKFSYFKVIGPKNLAFFEYNIFQMSIFHFAIFKSQLVSCKIFKLMDNPNSQKFTQLSKVYSLYFFFWVPPTLFLLLIFLLQEHALALTSLWNMTTHHEFNLFFL